MVVGPLTVKIYFDGSARPNPGAITIAVVIRGAVSIDHDVSSGSSGDAEWLALVHALELARHEGVRDALVLGDSASVIDQATGVARSRAPFDCAARFAELSAAFDRLRFRRIKRSQNLAGIALEQVRQRRLG